MRTIQTVGVSTHLGWGDRILEGSQLVLLHTLDGLIHPGGFFEPVLGMGGYLMQEWTSKSFRFLLRLWSIITCLLAMHSRYGDILRIGGFLGWYVMVQNRQSSGRSPLASRLANNKSLFRAQAFVRASVKMEAW